MRVIPAQMPSRAYDVLVGRGCLAGFGAALARRCAGGRALVCCDENVAPLYLEEVRSSLEAAGYDVSHVVIPAGEGQKTLARAEELYGVLYDRGVRRGDRRYQLIAGARRHHGAGGVVRQVAQVGGQRLARGGVRADRLGGQSRLQRGEQGVGR